MIAVTKRITNNINGNNTSQYDNIWYTTYDKH